jgi:hypothetical protein
MPASGLVVASALVAAGLGLLVVSEEDDEHPVRASTAAVPAMMMAVFMAQA